MPCHSSKHCCRKRSASVPLTTDISNVKVTFDPATGDVRVENNVAGLGATLVMFDDAEVRNLAAAVGCDVCTGDFENCDFNLFKSIVEENLIKSAGTLAPGSAKHLNFLRQGNVVNLRLDGDLQWTQPKTFYDPTNCTFTSGISEPDGFLFILVGNTDAVDFLPVPFDEKLQFVLRTGAGSFQKNFSNDLVTKTGFLQMDLKFEDVNSPALNIYRDSSAGLGIGGVPTQNGFQSVWEEGENSVYEFNLTYTQDRCAPKRVESPEPAPAVSSSSDSSAEKDCACLAKLFSRK